MRTTLTIALAGLALLLLPVSFHQGTPQLAYDQALAKDNGGGNGAGNGGGKGGGKGGGPGGAQAGAGHGKGKGHDKADKGLAATDHLGKSKHGASSAKVKGKSKVGFGQVKSAVKAKTKVENGQVVQSFKAKHKVKGISGVQPTAFAAHQHHQISPSLLGSLNAAHASARARANAAPNSMVGRISAYSGAYATALSLDPNDPNFPADYAAAIEAAAQALSQKANKPISAEVVGAVNELVGLPRDGQAEADVANAANN